MMTSSGQDFPNPYYSRAFSRPHVIGVIGSGKTLKDTLVNVSPLTILKLSIKSQKRFVLNRNQLNLRHIKSRTNKRTIRKRRNQISTHGVDYPHMVLGMTGPFESFRTHWAGKQTNILTFVLDMTQKSSLGAVGSLALDAVEGFRNVRHRRCELVFPSSRRIWNTHSVKYDG